MEEKAGILERWVFFILHILFALYFFWVVLNADYSLGMEMVRNPGLFSWVILFLSFLALNLLRAGQLWYLSPVSFSWVFMAFLFNNFFRDVLPMKERELAYMKKLYDLGFSRETPVFHILLIRIYDVLLSVFFLAALLLMGFIESRYQLFLGAGTGILFLILVFASSRFIPWGVYFLYPNFRHIRNKLKIGISRIQDDYKAFKPLSRLIMGVWGSVNAFVSLFIWVFILRILLPSLPLSAAIVASFFFKFLRIFPIYPILGLGVFEFFWYMAISGSDLNLRHIHTFSLLAHGIFLVQTLAFYFLGNLLEFRKKLDIFAAPSK